MMPEMRNWFSATLRRGRMAAAQARLNAVAMEDILYISISYGIEPGLLRGQNHMPISILRRPPWLRTGLRFGHSASCPHVAQTLEDLPMRTFDLSPLYRSTVGFDRLFSMLDGFESAPGYPPYNIERTGENEYRVTVAVAGFAEHELSIETKENTLTIKGSKQSKEEQNGAVLYQGIAARAFERVFQLADYVQVKNAALENGLLHVDLVREIPEAKKPRQIPIGNGQAKPQVVDTKAAA
jgi:molecular chaperone IbpA